MSYTTCTRRMSLIGTSSWRTYWSIGSPASSSSSTSASAAALPPTLSSRYSAARHLTWLPRSFRRGTIWGPRQTSGPVVYYCMRSCVGIFPSKDNLIRNSTRRSAEGSSPRLTMSAEKPNSCLARCWLLTLIRGSRLPSFSRTTG